jgi:L,D-transpeptidase ErfK/SrfK
VFGQAFYVKTRHEDTLLDIGRHNGLGYDEMKYANPGVDMWVPGEGRDVLLPTQYVLPNAPRTGLVLNLAEKRLYHFPSSAEVVTYAISIGREGWGTPLGNFSIVRKDKDPAWYPPASIRKEHAENGDPLPTVVPAGPDNPLGQYALRLSAAGYLIHGTNKPWGLGMQVSHGCIRMYPEDIERLFPSVPVSTSVRIVNQPFKVGWRGDDLYLEVHAKDEQRSKTPSEVIPASVANAQGVSVDWEEVRRAVNENTGLPHLVGGRQKPASRLYLDTIF